MPGIPDQAELGSFVPQFSNLDVEKLKDMDVNSEEFKELIIRLLSNSGLSNVVLNNKVSGYYAEQEFVCGKVLFPNPYNVAHPDAKFPDYRPLFRQTVNMGQLPVAGSINKPHNINILVADAPNNYSGYSIVHMYGGATNTSTGDFLPINATATTKFGNGIGLCSDATDVYINTTDDKSMFDTCYVVLEYVKS